MRYVPKRGAVALAHALAEACLRLIRVSEPVRREVSRDGLAPSHVLAEGAIEADAVICAVLDTKAPELIPVLADGVRTALAKMTYSIVPGRDWP